MWVNRDERISAQQLEKAAAALPLMKVGKPQDIAHAAVFLASNKSAGHITGQVISVNGGYSMAGQAGSIHAVIRLQTGTV